MADADNSGIESRLDNIATALGYVPDTRTAHYRQVVENTVDLVYPTDINAGDHFTLVDNEASLIKEFVTVAGVGDDWVEITSTSF